MNLSRKQANTKMAWEIKSALHEALLKVGLPSEVGVDTFLSCYMRPEYVPAIQTTLRTIVNKFRNSNLTKTIEFGNVHVLDTIAKYLHKTKITYTLGVRLTPTDKILSMAIINTSHVTGEIYVMSEAVKEIIK